MDYVELAATIVAAVGLGVTFAGVVVARRIHRDAMSRKLLYDQYSAFNELVRVRLDNPLYNHLFEVSETYDRTKEDVSHLLRASPRPVSREEFLLRERSTAIFIFQVFEHTCYQHEQAESVGDDKGAGFLCEVLDYFTGRLLPNSRLRYYWSAEGANVRVFFEKRTIEYYDQKVAEAGLSLQEQGADVLGPYPQAGGKRG